MLEDPSTDVVRKRSPEELEIEKKLVEIEAKKGRIAELELTLENLRLELGRFEVEYHARVGSLYVELDKLELQIDEYRTRISLLREKKFSIPEIEEAIYQEFKERRAKAEFYEQQTNGFREQYQAQTPFKRVSDEEENELKALYRKLAKIYHPDLSDSEAERIKHQKVMAEINKAYAEKDLNKLRDINRTAEEKRAREGETIAEKLIRLIRKSYELDEIIENLLKALDEISGSPTFKLKDAVERGVADGRDILAELEEDLRRKIEKRRRELRSIIQEYEELTAARQ